MHERQTTSSHTLVASRTLLAAEALDNLSCYTPSNRQETVMGLVSVHQLTTTSVIQLYSLGSRVPWYNIGRSTAWKLLSNLYGRPSCRVPPLTRSSSAMLPHFERSVAEKSTATKKREPIYTRSACQGHCYLHHCPEVRSLNIFELRENQHRIQLRSCRESAVWIRLRTREELTMDPAQNWARIER